MNYLLALLRRMISGPPPAAAPPPDPWWGVEESLELDDITGRLAAHRRTVYLPVVAAGDAPPATCKFSGAPFLAPGERWPECGNCGRPMQLFVQLAGDALPGEAQARIAPGELLQLFYCTSEDPFCDADCEAWAPHAKSTLVRLIAAAGEPGAPRVPDGMFPPLRIVGWTEQDDYPGYVELDDPSVHLEDPQRDVLWESFPRRGEKLLGWPDWVQDVEYPNCRICGTRMEMLFQIDSEGNVPYTFGDAGTGHITQCPAHPRELAFAWACT